MTKHTLEMVSSSMPASVTTGLQNSRALAPGVNASGTFFEGSELRTATVARARDLQLNGM